MKNCSRKKCIQINPQAFSCFSKNKTMKDGYSPECKGCMKIRLSGYDRKTYMKSYTLRKYGLSIEQRAMIGVLQNHNCAICGINENKLHMPLFVDHCHKTNIVRGLLCIKCNKDLAVVEDFEYLKAAKRYLNKKRNQ